MPRKLANRRHLHGAGRAQKKPSGNGFKMRLGPIIIGRVVIPSNEFPFDESYCKGINYV